MVSMLVDMARWMGESFEGERVFVGKMGALGIIGLQNSKPS